MLETIIAVIEISLQNWHKFYTAPNLFTCCTAYFLISRIPLSQDRFLTGSVKTDSGESLMIRRYQTLFYGNYSSYFLIMSAALCPPKPNVLLSAALMSRFFALLKVKSMV